MEKYDTIISWWINKACNLDCPYCVRPQDRTQDSLSSNFDVDKVVNTLNQTNKSLLVFLSGGEPFLHPNFIKLCQELTVNHFIAVETNLISNRVYDFCKTIDPRKIDFVSCSLHMPERNKQDSLEDFINKVKMLKQSGFNAFVTQVAWPPIINELPNLFDKFRKQNIAIIPYPFAGSYNNKPYPQSYTNKEKNIIFSLLNNSELFVQVFGPFRTPLFIRGLTAFTNSLFSYKDSLCYAGVNMIRIEPNGNVKRCSAKTESLGNIFKGDINFLHKPVECKEEYCACIPEGYISALAYPKSINFDKPNFFHSLRNILRKK